MTKEQILNKLRARCSRREYCKGQIKTLLKRWQVCEADILEIITLLSDEKFVDDLRFANAFVRDKLKFNGWGKQKIVYKLKSLEIDSSVIDKAILENYYGGMDENLSGEKALEKLVKKKWDSLKKEEPLQVKRAKILRFAVGRGFEYNDVLEILKNF